MSRAISWKKPSSLPPPPTPTTVAASCAKKKRSPRSPLQDLNRISSSSNSSYASSSTVSIESPKGCLRFLSSSSFRTPIHKPKNNISKTPKSLPSAIPLKQSKSKSSKENLPEGKAGLKTKKLDKAPPNRKNPPCGLWQSGQKTSSRTAQKSKTCSALNEPGKFLPKLPSSYEDSKLIVEDRHEANLTPLSRKVTRSDLDSGSTVHEDVEETLNRSISRMPPIQNSVSPELQCGSSLVSTTTPACYAAGYVVSGVTDKRKCRPRGILTVEQNCSGLDKMALNSFDDDDDVEKKITDVNNNTSPSLLLPLPTEALVHWLSSPLNKGKKVLSQKFENGLNQSQGLAESSTIGCSTSPSSSSKTFWNLSDSSDLSSAYGIRRKVRTSISPSELSEFRVPFGSILSPSYPSMLFSPISTPSCHAPSSEKGKNDQHNLIDENSPFSANSLGSGNVIQTPKSDSSSDLHVGISLVHAANQKQDNLFSKVLLSENLLSSSAPLKDSVNSSFQFDCLNVPYESIDLSKLPKFLDDDKEPWLSSSTVENTSQSRMRISWREGLMSQLYELDECDCCRCLSDEEDLVNNDSGEVNVEVVDGDEKVKVDAVGITETEIDVPGKEICPNLISCPGAESISTDGDGLAASRDASDWTFCYKNKLFDV